MSWKLNLNLKGDEKVSGHVDVLQPRVRVEDGHRNGHDSEKENDVLLNKIAKRSSSS